jgi:hypothetical protein
MHLFTYLLFLGLFFSLASSHVIADANPPRLVSIDFESCESRTEVCGSGLDENCDGFDAPCPGNDKDRDGFPDSQDCDDANKFIYPGISVSCSESCGSGVKTCQSSGIYTSCTCVPFCEAGTDGTCYYVDPIQGTFSGSGTFQNRMKSLQKLLSEKPQKLKGGDVVYLFSGVYEIETDLGTKGVILEITDINTPSGSILIKNYPGAIPVLNGGETVSGIKIVNSRNIIFEGLHIHATADFACMLKNSDDIVLRNVMIKNTLLRSSEASVLVARDSKGFLIERSVLTGTKDQRKSPFSFSNFSIVGLSEVNVIHSTID